MCCVMRTHVLFRRLTFASSSLLHITIIAPASQHLSRQLGYVCRFGAAAAHAQPAPVSQLPGSVTSLGLQAVPARLMVLLHLTSAVALAGSWGLAERFDIVNLGPIGGPEICWLSLLLNFIGKVWCFYRLTPCCGRGIGSKLSCLYMSCYKLSCLYMSCSEDVLLLLVLAPDLSRVAISTTGDHHHAYPWVEMSRDGQRQILTLYFFILMLMNVAPFCLFGALVCKRGMKALEEPPAWKRSLHHTTQ